VIGGHLTVFAISVTGDSDDRVTQAGLSPDTHHATFPVGTQHAGPGDAVMPAPVATYNALDLDANAPNVALRDKGTRGWSISADRVVAVVEPSKCSKSDFLGTLRHEAQHATDDHKMTPWGRYQSEYRAYFINEGGTSIRP
jgi:hypothetical protein